MSDVIKITAGALLMFAGVTCLVSDAFAHCDAWNMVVKSAGALMFVGGFYAIVGESL